MVSPAPRRVIGVLLAAGAGRRMGRPKATVVAADGEPWVVRGARVLLEGGCDEVLVVLGAEAQAARQLLTAADLGATVTATDARDWSRGIAASLAHGVSAALEAHADVLVVTLVDLPHLSPEAVRRLAADADSGTLRQAVYAGRPGHPVIVGADRAPALLAALDGGDRGARPFLVAHGAAEIDCTDLGGGDDVDRPVAGIR
jgi:CTP:molybdopterin cytidylyltransferase MocA